MRTCERREFLWVFIHSYKFQLVIVVVAAAALPHPSSFCRGATTAGTQLGNPGTHRHVNVGNLTASAGLKILSMVLQVII